MLVEVSFWAMIGDVPIVWPKNLVQLTLQILMVFPLAIENTVEKKHMMIIKIKRDKLQRLEARQFQLPLGQMMKSLLMRLDILWDDS